MTVNTVTRDFTVSDRLHVESVASHPPRSFDTTSAHWSDAQQRLVLDRPVQIHTGAGDPLLVSSLVFNVKTGEIEVHGISGPVRFK